MVDDQIHPSGARLTPAQRNQQILDGLRQIARETSRLDQADIGDSDDVLGAVFAVEEQIQLLNALLTTTSTLYLRLSIEGHLPT